MVASPADGTVSVLLLRALLAGASFHGLGPAELGLSFDPAVLTDPDARVPARLVLELWETLPKRTGKEHFGLWLAELVRAAPLTAASWLILSSPTLREGLMQAVRFQRLLHDQASGELSDTERGVTYVHRVGSGAFRAPRHAIEFGFAQIVLLARRATGREVVPVVIGFQHARPAEPSAHRSLFGLEPSFGAERDQITFDHASCALPVLGADPALGELVMAHARALIERLPRDDSWTARVQRILAAELPRTMLSVDDVASAAAVTRRTLQRRLSEEGTSFEEVADGLRRNLAERYLREQRVSVQETAFLLGYSEVSAFHRAFQRWTGLSPARFRDQG